MFSTPPLNIEHLKNKIKNACIGLQKKQILATTERKVIYVNRCWKFKKNANSIVHAHTRNKRIKNLKIVDYNNF